MSALTERISRHHRVRSIESTDTKSPGIECGCGYIPERMTWGEYAAHVAAVTEAATRAAVAAEIDSVGHHWSGAPALAFFALATDIREGKQP